MEKIINKPPCYKCKIQWLKGYTQASRKILCEYCYEKGEYKNFDLLPGLPNKIEDALKQFQRKPKKSTIEPYLVVRREKRGVIMQEITAPIY